MKYVFTGGGTLGHTNPAVAVAESIREIDKSADILFIMRERGTENDAVRKRNFNVQEIPSLGLSNKMLNNIKTFSVTVKSIFECHKVIKEFAPDVIFGTGGYVSFSPIIIGRVLGIPTFVHESNLIPGTVTKIAARIGAKILLNYEETRKHFPESSTCIVVGNPILKEFSTVTRESARKSLRLLNDDIFILSFGGSGGAQELNNQAIRIMEMFSCTNAKTHHLHATGEKYYSTLAEKYPALANGINGCKIIPRIENMATFMNAADIVISRCGSNSISEIIATNTAAILIPSPNVKDNHQYQNGKYLSSLGAAVMIEEKDLGDDILLNKIKYFTRNKQFTKELKTNLIKLKKINVAETISVMLITDAKQSLP